MSQYELVPQPLNFTSATSRKEDKSGARKAPKTRKMLRSCNLSKRRPSSTNLQIKNAPNNAWKELLMNHDRTIAVGTPLWISEAM
jgi:hypothetical protein